MADGIGQALSANRDLIAGIGQGAQALGAYRESNRMSKEIMRSANEAAAFEQQANITEMTKIARQRRAVFGAGLARAGASGVDTSSFEDVFVDSNQQGLLDEALQDYSSKYRQRQLVAQGRTQASEARFKGMKEIDTYMTRAQDSMTRWNDKRSTKPAPGSAGDPIKWNLPSWSPFGTTRF